jgi:hypothetical protein
MNTYQITAQSNPFTDYTLAIEAQINASQSVSQEVGSTHEAGSPAFLADFQVASDNMENYYKTIAEYSVQDSNRNATFTYEPIPDSPNYILTSTWTVENAVMNLTAETNTDLLDTDLESHLQAVTDQAVAGFKSLIFMTDL